jgi:uncharacterized protein involved in type VI secretion and phage assembly
LSGGIAELLSGGVQENEILAASDTSATLAVVTNINDPDKLGRVKCKPVTNDADVAETDWCYCMAPYGGNGYGLFAHPNVDDLVVLNYLHGEITRPFVMGSMWMGEKKPPFAVESGKNEAVLIQTPGGVEIRLELTAKKEKISLKTPAGAFFKIDDEAKKITLQDKDAKGSVVMEYGGNITVTSGDTLTLAAGSNKITLNKSGDIEIKSSKSVKVDTAQVDIKAKSALGASGATVEVKANASMALKSSGIFEAKGSLMKLN